MDSREHPSRLRNDSISEENEQMECGSQAGSLGSRYVVIQQWPNMLLFFYGGRQKGLSRKIYVLI